MPFALSKEHPNGSPKTRPMQSTAYSQAKHLQSLLLNDADIPDLKPITRAAIARAFCELEECKRKLKMKPLPGSLRPTESRAKRKVKEQVSFTPAPVETPQAHSNCGPDTTAASGPGSSVVPETPQEQK